MTLGGYNGSTNDCARVSGALTDDTNEASDEGVREGCVVAGNSPQETPYICMAVRLREAAEPTNTRASATRATPTQSGFAQPHSSPRPAFSSTCRLPASTHGAAQPPRHQQPQLARAPAGHRSPTGSRGFRPLVRHPPPLEPPSPRPRVRASSVKPTDALKSCSMATCPPHLGPGSAPSRAGRHRRLGPPA